MLRATLQRSNPARVSRRSPLLSTPSLRLFTVASTSTQYLGHWSLRNRAGEDSALRSSRIIQARYDGHRVMFHSTPRREGAPLVALLAGVLKASVSLEYARMAARIALSLVPFVLIRQTLAKKFLRHIAQDKPEFQAKKEKLQRKILNGRRALRVMIGFPILLFALTAIASAERTPLTGRWRLILLSPEEEDAIATQLAGTGWYKAVGEILAQEGPANIIPPSDWRYQWVHETLRHLESFIPILSIERFADTPWLERGPDDVPLPPPARYPLRPRPSGKDYLRWFCDACNSREAHPSPHTVPGPPYSLVVVNKPGCENAFSFGFGPDGGAGIVVYSGFLEKLLAGSPCAAAANDQQGKEETSAETPTRGFWTTLFGSLSLSPRQTSPTPTFTPTPEQSSQLAILLAHELAHLILSHHLETLSSGTIVVPGALSIFSDIVRTLLFPVTMLFGPFVNDAVARVGALSQGDLSHLTDMCTSVLQEFEADAVSARLLAHAGYDARKTVEFWEARRDAVSECNPPRREEKLQRKASLVRRIMGDTHPVHEERVGRLRDELSRWSAERERALRMLRQQAAKDRVKRDD